jgi:hypothetical protein
LANSPTVIFCPQMVFLPHPPDEFTETCIDSWTAWWKAGAPAPEQAPCGAVPADDGLGFHGQDGVHETAEAARQCADEPAIESAPAGAFDLASDDDELLANDQVFGDQRQAAVRAESKEKVGCWFRQEKNP